MVSLFVYLEVYNYNFVCLLSFGFFVARLFVRAVVETEKYHASTSPDIAKFR